MMFTLNADAPLYMSSQRGKLFASYSELVTIFGEPNSVGDEYKVSTEWVFISIDDYGVALYDWKETSLYDPDYPSVEAFRRDTTSKQQWSIGARDYVQALEFYEWAEGKLKALREGV